MAAALLVGNLALLVDARSSAMPPERRHSHSEMLISRPKRERDAHAPPPLPLLFLSIHSAAGGGGGAKSFHEDGRRSAAGSSSKVGAASSSGSNGDGGGDGGGDWDWEWEEKLRSRLKEMEEMRELEKRAEELQSRVAEEEGERGGREETEEEKRGRVRRELEKVAKEQAERRETAKLMFELGQKAYGKGMYTRAIEFLEAALTIIPRPTLFGGEIQIWLAMAYEANNRHRDCIELYQSLEKTHPSVSIRRQASELRYILQAPKLKISKDEMVTIPLIGSSYDRYAGSWRDKYKDRGQRRKTVTTSQLPSSRDFLTDFMVWRPPSGWEKNRNFWVILSLWLGLIGTALLLQR